MQALSFAFSMKDAVKIFEAPQMPGKNTYQTLKDLAQYFAFTESKEVRHKHEGQDVAVTFYRLADERGWVHDFNSGKPGEKSIHIATTTVHQPTFTRNHHPSHDIYMSSDIKYMSL